MLIWTDRDKDRHFKGFEARQDHYCAEWRRRNGACPMEGRVLEVYILELSSLLRNMTVETTL